MCEGKRGEVLMWEISPILGAVWEMAITKNKGLDMRISICSAKGLSHLAFLWASGLSCRCLCAVSSRGTQSDQGASPLIEAVRARNAARVRLLLDTGQIDVNDVDRAGLTALHYAARLGSPKIVRLLLGQASWAGKLKADLNKRTDQGDTALHYAVGLGGVADLRMQIATELAKIRHGRPSPPPELLAAFAQGEFPESLLDWCREQGIVLTDQQLRENDQALDRRADYAQVVELLLARPGLDLGPLDGAHRSLWQLALWSGDKKIVGCLLDRQSSFEDRALDSGAWNLLHEAACSGHLGVMKELLGKLTPYEKHRWINALATGLVEEARIEKSHLVLRRGDAPLHAAVWMGYPEIVDLLIEVGADRSLENGLEGYSCLDLSACAGHVALIKREKERIASDLWPGFAEELLLIAKRSKRYKLAAFLHKELADSWPECLWGLSQEFLVFTFIVGGLCWIAAQLSALEPEEQSQSPALPLPATTESILPQEGVGLGTGPSLEEGVLSQQEDQEQKLFLSSSDPGADRRWPLARRKEAKPGS